MKKILIALVLGLLLVSLIATPVSAKPARDTLVPTSWAEGVEETASVSGSIAPTRANLLKVTIRVRGAMPDTQYSVVVFDGTNTQSWVAFYLTTDSKGAARGSHLTYNSLTTYNDGDTVSFRLNLVRSPYNRFMWGDLLDVKF